MIKIKYYRWLKTLFGHRSFVKVTDQGTTHMLLKGSGIESIVQKFLDDGYTEEWPLT